VKKLRQEIANQFGAKLSQQPIHALINVGNPAYSRILLAPLTKKAGGWGQINGWSDLKDPARLKMKKLVESCIIPIRFPDTPWGASVEGRCGCAWVYDAEAEYKKKIAKKQK